MIKRINPNRYNCKVVSGTFAGFVVVPILIDSDDQGDVRCEVSLVAHGSAYTVSDVVPIKPLSLALLTPVEYEEHCLLPPVLDELPSIEDLLSIWFANI